MLTWRKRLRRLVLGMGQVGKLLHEEESMEVLHQRAVAARVKVLISRQVPIPPDCLAGSQMDFLLERCVRR